MGVVGRWRDAASARGGHGVVPVHLVRRGLEGRLLREQHRLRDGLGGVVEKVLRGVVVMVRGGVRGGHEQRGSDGRRR